MVRTSFRSIDNRSSIPADKTDQNKPVPYWQFSRGAGTDEVYREFRTNRRPLNVASVVSRTVEQEISSVPAPRETGGDRPVQMGL